MRLKTTTLPFPSYTTGERIADLVVHAFGIVGSTAGIAVLLIVAIGRVSVFAILSVAIYGIGLLTVFCCSAAYNFVSNSSWKAVLRQLDHAAIYIKIAATHTPFIMLKMASWSGAFLLLIVWAVAVFGLTLKLWFPERLIKTSYALYLAQGWAALLVAGPLAASLSSLTLTMLCLGGVLYTIGVAFHFWHSLRYHNATWHAFVVAGSACHFIAVLDTISVA